MSDRPPQSLEAFRQESLLKRNWILFWSYIKITSLVLGGGYAIIAAAQEEFVRRRGWLTDDDVVEMITITQTVPGILACNSAIYVGSADTAGRFRRWPDRCCRRWSSSC